jgi:hypothetical protein
MEMVAFGLSALIDCGKNTEISVLMENVEISDLRFMVWIKGVRLFIYDA